MLGEAGSDGFGFVAVFPVLDFRTAVGWGLFMRISVVLMLFCSASGAD